MTQYMWNHPNLVVFPNDDALATAAAAAWWKIIATAAQSGNRHLVALSGGRVAGKMFAAMVAEAAAGGVDLGCMEFFWADERCVPPDDPESNYLLAYEGLLAPLKIADCQIHRIVGEDGPERAATAAAASLIQVAQPEPATMPVVDLVLLGMGEDGHIASLFPGDDAAAGDLTSVFRPVFDSPKPPPWRVTLGYGPLLAARDVWVLAAGAGKAAALSEALSPTGKSPLARLLQLRPSTRVFSAVSYAR
jgi:6-phosphogluconolactonase